MEKEQIIQAIIKQGVLPLYYHPDAETTVQLARTLYEAGIRVIEYTNRGDRAIDNFRQLILERDKSMPGLLIGIGTVKNEADARNFLEAKADFIICPIVVPTVAYIVHKAGKLWIPGCMTVTEIALAESNGAALVKLFPGNVLGPGFVSAVKDLFPDLLMMPTGGVDVSRENIEAWFKAGVCAVGMGSKLIQQSETDKKEYNMIKTRTEKVIQIIQEIDKTGT